MAIKIKSILLSTLCLIMFLFCFAGCDESLSDKQQKEELAKQDYETTQTLCESYNTTLVAINEVSSSSNSKEVIIDGFDALSTNKKVLLWNSIVSDCNYYLNRIKSNEKQYNISIMYGGQSITVKEDGQIIFSYPDSPANTPYAMLNDYQKKRIGDYIQGRYDYYDDRDGKYTGDKYTTTIFNEAASMFRKSYSEIDKIWGDQYYIKQSLKNNTSKLSSTYSIYTHSSYPIDITLNDNYEGGNITKITINPGDSIYLDPPTERDNHVFLGWYSDAETTEPIGTLLLKEPTTVYAKWESTIDEAGLLGVQHYVDYSENLITIPFTIPFTGKYTFCYNNRKAFSMSWWTLTNVTQNKVILSDKSPLDTASFNKSIFNANAGDEMKLVIRGYQGTSTTFCTNYMYSLEYTPNNSTPAKPYVFVSDSYTSHMVHLNNDFHLDFTPMEGYEFIGYFAGDEQITDSNGDSLAPYEIPWRIIAEAKYEKID